MTELIDGMNNPLWLIAGAIVVILLILWLKQQQNKTLDKARKPEETETQAEAAGQIPGLLPEAPSVSALAEELDELSEFQFDELEFLSIAGNWEVHLRCRAMENSCRIGITPAFAQFVKIEHVRNGLRIRYTGKKCQDGPMTIEISTVAVPKQVKVAEKCRIWIDSIETGHFDCKADGGGKIEMHDAKIGEFELKLTDDCRAECRGHFETAELEATDGCNAKLRGTIGKFTARLSGASKGEVTRTGKAEICISGASKLKLEADGKVEGDLSGGSSLKLRGKTDASGLRISGSSKLRSWK